MELVCPVPNCARNLGNFREFGERRVSLTPTKLVSQYNTRDWKLINSLITRMLSPICRTISRDQWKAMQRVVIWPRSLIRCRQSRKALKMERIKQSASDNRHRLTACHPAGQGMARQAMTGKRPGAESCDREFGPLARNLTPTSCRTTRRQMTTRKSSAMWMTISM